MGPVSSSMPILTLMVNVEVALLCHDDNFLKSEFDITN